MLCLGVVIVLYVSVAFVLTGIVPYKEIDVGNALPAALARIGIRWGGALVATGAIIGMISTLLVTLYGQVRIFMVMARDGLLPGPFAKVHPKHKTPHICTWITGVATALIAGLFPLPMIIDLCNIGTLFAFVLVSIGVIVLRKTRPEVERKFKTPGVPFTPLITVGFCFYLMASLPGSDLDPVRSLAAGRPGDLFHVRRPPQQAAEDRLGFRVRRRLTGPGPLLICRLLSESEELKPYPARPSDR